MEEDRRKMADKWKHEKRNLLWKIEEGRGKRKD
jgi:hypothetical protein